ncbi:MAG: MFS transporter [Eggerthellaceae bacterium]|nr:MFS transporter [Eggerthellaceae bacterium]
MNDQPKKESIWSVAFVILLMANFFQSMATFMANTTLPLYVESLGAGAGAVGIVIGAFAITSLLSRPFAGPAFDSFSRKKLLMCAQGAIAASFVLYGFTKSIPAVFAVRLLHGLGIGCIAPLAMSLVSEYLPQPKMASGISVFTLSQTMAQVIGPAMGLWLIDALGYQNTYLIAAGLLFASFASIIRLKEIERERPPYQLKPNRMFARKAISGAAVLGLFATAYGATTSYLVLYGTKLGISHLGAYFMVYAFCLMATRPLFGSLSDRFGAHRILIPGTLCFAASYVMLAHVHSFSSLMVVAVMASAGFAACVPLVQSMAMTSVPPQRRGAACNTVYTGLDLGNLLGPIIAGGAIELLQPTCGSLLSAYAHMWYVMIIPQVLALGIIVWWNVHIKTDSSINQDDTSN